MNALPLLRSTVARRFALLAVGVVLFAGNSARAQLITHRITIQPIQITNVGATVVGNASLSLFEAATDKVWAQAGIDIQYNSWITYASNTFINATNPASGQASSLAQLTTNNAAFPWNSLPTTVVRMFFVNTIDGNVNILGVSHQNYVPEFYNPAGGQISSASNGILIANRTFTLGYIDTIAHELGHMLGSDHENNNAFSQSGRNLMLESPTSFPTSISNIFPDGNDSSQLTADQKTAAKYYHFAVPLPVNQQYTYTAVPEPAHIAVVAGALVLAAGLYRRRRAARG